MAIKDLPKEEYILPGSAACPGCPATIGLRIILKALGRDTIMVIPACCTAVIESWYPKTSFDIPILNIAFEASAAAASGIVSALKKLGREKTNVVVWAGDGGTYDIGLQAMSGAFERETDFIYICYNNQIYSNTGIQRSGATPYGAWTTTTVGGKKEVPKDMGAIVRAHHIPYVATASISYPEDLYRKVMKAKQIRGPKYIEILTPCPPGWRFSMDMTIEMGRLAVETGVWPLYEYENERMIFNGISKAIIEGKYKRKPVDEWLKLQGRFSHLFKPKRDEERIRRFQEYVDEMWERFKRMITPD
ncbi:MAG TPA: 3-methyl-2-oxobutanoate dehydrogenase subunit beta [Thermoplasmatales archaeon]|nr:3-methyl-2-oxobutanoate dehydrogenase subunit beta [Thermoplasmatales archaeon]HEX17436.1 3-methyl-2-oxobutanoate dehydrogenase subunit beta [Thermoplasmatales archaeon]